MELLHSVLFCSVLLFAFSCGVKIEECTEKGDVGIPTPISFTSEGCTTPPCPLTKGTTSNGNITFRIPNDVEKATVIIKAKVMGMWVPFQPPDTNICHSLLNSYCPLDKNEVVIFNMAIPVKSFYPVISLTLKVKIVDENNRPLMCMKVGCKVVKKSQ